MKSLINTNCVAKFYIVTTSFTDISEIRFLQKFLIWEFYAFLYYKSFLRELKNSLYSLLLSPLEVKFCGGSEFRIHLKYK